MADQVEESAQLSRLGQLRQNEQHWIWKAGLRTLLCVLDIIAIGSLGWILSTRLRWEFSYYDYDIFPGASAGALVAVCVSLIWCLLCLAVPFTLKPTRPIHPGVAVGADLILWLGFIFVALLSIGAIIEVMYFGSNGYISDPSYGSTYNYNGGYYLAPNNTWIYNVTSVYNNGYGYYNYTTGGYSYPNTDPSTVVRDCTPQFINCTVQDAYVNKLWHERPTMEGVRILVSACLWLAVLFHFILFVWACVDTHRRNRMKRVPKAQLISDKIIQDLEKRGLIHVKNGVVVSAGGIPNNSAPNAPATEPLLAPIPASRNRSQDAITPV